MTARSIILALAASTFVTGTALGAEPAPAKVRQACAQDFRQYCRDVAPGNGRLKQCMASHADRLSEPCRTALKSEESAAPRK